MSKYVSAMLCDSDVWLHFLAASTCIALPVDSFDISITHFCKFHSKCKQVLWFMNGTGLVHTTGLLCRHGDKLTLHVGQRSFTFLAIPAIVPPVPAPHTNMSSLPVHSHTSLCHYIYLPSTTVKFEKYVVISKEGSQIIHNWAICFLLVLCWVRCYSPPT